MADRLSSMQQHLESQRLLAEQIALNERMQQALRISRAGTYSWDPKAGTFEWNAYCCELHGFGADANETLPIEDVLARIPASELPEIERLVYESRDQRTPFEATYRVLWDDDTTHWIQARGVWEYAPDGKPLHLFGIAYDADRQKRIELELAASEQRLRDAQAASQLGAWEYETATGDMSVSEEFCRVHGISLRRFKAHDTLLGIPKSDHHLIVAGITAAREPGGVFDVEHRAVHGETGETIWIHGRGRGYFDDAGDLVRIVGTNQDVTARKAAEIAFLETARVFRALTQASPALIFRADSEGDFTFINEEQWRDFSGLEADEWQGKGWLDAFHPADRARAQDAWQHAVIHAQPFAEEYRWRNADGRIRWLLLHAQPVFDGDQLASFVGTGTDVSALKSSERERATLQLALAESQKMEAIGTLASGVAHDFNNFLAAVRGYVELARLKLDEDGDAARDKASQFLQQAEAAIDQAKDVTDGLLTFSRGSTAQHGPLCLNSIIADNVDLLRQLVPASVHIKSHLPAKEIWINGDSTQLRQILINLVINGRDALPETGGDIDVTLSFEGDDWAAIFVTDNGRGMSHEAQERAFEPFFTTKQPGQGTGLGLAVVHGIVLTHEGDMDIKSQAGVGTEVEIRLPLTEIRNSPVHTVERSEQAPGRKRVLFVEDNPLVRESCALRMEASGYTVITAENGEIAMELFKNRGEHFDAALLDVDLPGDNGVNIAAHMRKLQPDLAVIYVTGNLKNPALDAVREADPVLPKPIDYNALFRTINEITKAQTLA